MTQFLADPMNCFACLRTTVELTDWFYPCQVHRLLQLYVVQQWLSGTKGLERGRKFISGPVVSGKKEEQWTYIWLQLLQVQQPWAFDKLSVHGVKVRLGVGHLSNYSTTVMLSHADMTPSSQLHTCCLNSYSISPWANRLCGCVDHCIWDYREIQVALLSHRGSRKWCLKPFNCDFYITLDKLQFWYCFIGGHLRCCSPLTVEISCVRADSTMEQSNIWTTWC